MRESWTVSVEEMDTTEYSCLFASPWTVALQAPLSMGFFKQEYWSGLPFPLPWNFPHPGIKPLFPASPAFAGEFFTAELPGKLKREGGYSCVHCSWHFGLSPENTLPICEVSQAPLAIGSVCDHREEIKCLAFVLENTFEDLILRCLQESALKTSGWLGCDWVLCAGALSFRACQHGKNPQTTKWENLSYLSSFFFRYVYIFWIYIINSSIYNIHQFTLTWVCIFFHILFVGDVSI